MVVTKRMDCGNTALLKRTVSAKMGGSVKILTPCSLPFEQLPPSYCRKTAGSHPATLWFGALSEHSRLSMLLQAGRPWSSLFDHFHSVGLGLDVDLSEMSALLLKKDNQ